MRGLICFFAVLAAAFSAGSQQAALLPPIWQTCVGQTGAAKEKQIEACTAIIKENKDTPFNLSIAYNNRGSAYAELRQFDRAIMDFDQAIRLAPDDPVAIYNRGKAYWTQGDFPKAIIDFGNVIALKPENADAWIFRGIARADAGQFELAIRDFGEAIRLRPGDALGYANRGVAQAKIGRFDLATRDLSTAIQLNPKDHFAYSNRALAYYLQGLNDRAIADVEAALALKADFGRAYGIRGRVYFALGEFDLAIADLEKGLKLDPSLGDWAKSALAEARAAKAALADREKAANTGARIAMVIGNSKYEHDAELPNSRRDAKAVASQFKALGYKIFGDPERDYTKAQMEAEIEAFRKAVVGADAAILWYTGHGQKMREEGAEYADDWVIPVDAKIKKRADISKAAVRVERLKNSVLAAKTLRLVVIDACRDSKFYTGAMGVGGMGDRNGLKGALVVYSTQPGNVADAGPDNGRSPFTQAFLELLPANAKADIRKFFAAVVARTLQLNSDQRPEPIDGLATDQDVTLAK